MKLSKKKISRFDLFRPNFLINLATIFHIIYLGAVSKKKPRLRGEGTRKRNTHYFGLQKRQYESYLPCKMYLPSGQANLREEVLCTRCKFPFWMAYQRQHLQLIHYVVIKVLFISYYSFEVVSNLFPFK